MGEKGAWSRGRAKSDKREGLKIALKALFSTGADLVNGGLKAGEMYFAGVFYNAIVEVIIMKASPAEFEDEDDEDLCTKAEGHDWQMPTTGWFGSGLVPPLVAYFKDPFEGNVLGQMILCPVPNAPGVLGMAGVGKLGFGAAVAAAGVVQSAGAELAPVPISGNLEDHTHWSGPSGWAAVMGEHPFLTKVPTQEAEAPPAPGVDAQRAQGVA